MEPRCTDSYFVHIRSRDLIQHAGDALHTCSAVHALDLKEQFCHIPPPPIDMMLDPGAGCKRSLGGGQGVLRVKSIADAAHGPEKDGIGRICFDIAAQAHDEVVDGAGVRILAHAPYLLEQLLA
jgi:hypothetical protein